MSAAEFNAQIGTIGQELLVPLGFQQKGAHFFLYRPPVILGVIKATFRGNFTGFHVVLTFDFLEGTPNANGQPRHSTLLEDYPVAIEAHALRAEFSRTGRAMEFRSDMNFISREVMPTRAHEHTASTPPHTAPMSDAEIRDVFAIVGDEGMRLCSQFDLALAHHAVMRYPSRTNPPLERLRSGIAARAAATGVALSKPRKGLFGWW